MNQARPTEVLSGALFGAVQEVLLHLLWEHSYEDHVSPQLLATVFIKVGRGQPINKTNLKERRGETWREKVIMIVFSALNSAMTETDMITGLFSCLV